MECLDPFESPWWRNLCVLIFMHWSSVSSLAWAAVCYRNNNSTRSQGLNTVKAEFLLWTRTKVWQVKCLGHNTKVTTTLSEGIACTGCPLCVIKKFPSSLFHRDPDQWDLISINTLRSLDELDEIFCCILIKFCVLSLRCSLTLLWIEHNIQYWCRHHEDVK